MKRLVLTLAILAGFALGGMAQNVWKPINIPGTLKGVAANGDLFIGETGIQRSQDEGESWQIVLGGTSYYNGNDGFTISPNGRIFDLPYNQNHLCISDDGGDTWRNSPDFLYSSLENAPMYAVSDDTLFLYSAAGDTLLWTLDGGNTWDKTCLPFLDHDQNGMGPWFGAMLADGAGNVYIGTWGWAPPESGVFQANLDNMNEWSLIISDSYVQSLVFDIEGNIVIDCPAVANNGIFFSTQRIDGDSMVLTYSTDHGVNYTPIGEGLPSTQTVPETGLRLFKGGDQHLYCHGDIWSGGTITQTQYYKSIQRADEISIPLNGILTRVPAPYFEQNVCDTRLAIVSGEETFYVTVDGFWPNPNLDALVVRYDTIPIGTAIDVSGTIKTMSDELGNPFYVIDIQETTAHYYDAITSLLKGFGEYLYIQPDVSPYQVYYLTINGERQTSPLVFNGVTYEGYDLRTYIGHCSIQTDSIGNEFMGMELQDIQPFRDYTFDLEDGTLSTNYWNPLYLFAPIEDQHFLTFLWGDFTFPSPFYPMHNGHLYKESFINNDIFREGTHVNLKGIEHIRYDIYGFEVNTVEIVEMNTEEETTLTGTIETAPMPFNSFIPVPGVEIVFKSNGRKYYLYNQQGTSYNGEYFVVDNDTIYEGQEITATFTSKILIDNRLNFYYRININEAEVLDPILPPGAEWYYEIQNENGSITYQYMYQAGDTIIQDEPTHILVKINTLYDKGLHEEITHEYVYERDGKLYWWNKTLEVFTVLYDYEAEVGDYWEIIVGTRPIDMHVDAVEEIEYEGRTYRMLRVSDPEDLFSGNIVCGIGHLTSFFPERLMDNGDGLRVEGLRCYWIEDELVFKYGDEDCDAIYSEVHGVEEDGPSTPSTGSGTAGTFTVYPNPTNGVLFVETVCTPSLPDQTYRITNLMGQTLLTGKITDENQQIDVSSLPQGMYFITFASETRKFVVR